MIKANELRIGNLVELNGNNYRVNLVSNNFIEINVGGRARGGNTSEHNPIPLTPEILNKCVFADKRIFDVTDIAIPTKYLHQLQNLYFALTGEELPIQF